MAIVFLGKSLLTAEVPDLAQSMMPKSSQELHEPPAPAESAPSALEERTEELLLENVEHRKGALGDGQKVSQVRQAVEDDFNIKTKANEFGLIKQIENEIGAKSDKYPVSNSTFNEIKDFQSKVQDGLGGGKAKHCSNQEEPHA